MPKPMPNKAGKFNASAGFRLPGQMPIKKLVREYRKEQRGQGVHGRELRQAVRGRREELREQERQQMLEGLPESVRPYIQNPRKFLRGGRLGFIRRLAAYNAARGVGPDEYGEKIRQDLAEHYRGAMPEPGKLVEVDTHRELSPVTRGVGEYISSRFTTPGDFTSDLRGLSPAEEAMYRARLRAPVEQSYQMGLEDEANRLAGAGVGAGSGLARLAALRLQQMRQQGLTQAEHGVVQEDLARKRDYERMMGEYAPLEESARRTDVSAGLERTRDVESGMRDLWMGGESARQFDYGLTEGARQADLARRDRQRALRLARPGVLERVGGVLGGIATGLGG